MTFEWHVVVHDNAAGNITDAEVALVQESALVGEYPFDGVPANLGHLGDGAYEPSSPLAPVAGNWVLIVRRKGISSPAVQLLVMTAAGGAFAVSTRGGAVATVEVKSVVSGKGAAAVRRSAFTVKLFPSAEVVFLSGIDYFGSGVNFRLFAEDHAKALFIEKLVDLGTRITLFSCDDRTRFSFAFSSSGKLVQLFAHVFGTGAKPGKGYVPADHKDISATDFYRYLSSVGLAEKNRVHEVGIFSHSWPGGPILFDTADTTGDARVATDFDLRQKDFKPANTVSWPNLKDAMATGGRWQIWGCSATTFFKDLMREALKTKTDDSLFVTVTDVNHHEGGKSQHVEARTTRKRVRTQMDKLFHNGSYMAAVSNFLGIAVFGAPPGVGADYSVVSGLSVMGIKGDTAPYAFFKADFSPDFAPTIDPFNHGYIDYKVMQARAAPPASPFDSAVYSFQVDFDNNKTNLSFAAPAKAPPAHPSATVKLQVTAKTNFPTAGRSGNLYVITDTADAAKSEAFYLQQDGTLFSVTRDGANAFTVVAAAPL
jgi:hypothetical protein